MRKKGGKRKEKASSPSQLKSHQQCTNNKITAAASPCRCRSLFSFAFYTARPEEREKQFLLCERPPAAPDAVRLYGSYIFIHQEQEQQQASLSFPFFPPPFSSFLFFSSFAFPSSSSSSSSSSSFLMLHARMVAVWCHRGRKGGNQDSVEPNISRTAFQHSGSERAHAR